MPAKTLNIPLGPAEYAELKEVKGERTWKETILQECGVE